MTLNETKKLIAERKQGREVEKQENEKKVIENQNQFFNWLRSLKPYELLDLLMNCGFLLGKTITPETQKENEDGKNNNSPKE